MGDRPGGGREPGREGLPTERRGGASSHKLLGTLLREQGLLTTQQLEAALHEQHRSGKLLGRVIVDLGFLREEELLKVVGHQVGLDAVDLTDLQVEPTVLTRVSASVAKTYQVLPLAFDGRTLTVAVADPLEIHALDDLRFMLGVQIQAKVAHPEQLQRAIARHYGPEGESLDQILQAIQRELPTVESAVAGADMDAASLQELAAQAPVVRLLNLVLLEAIQQRASDVHLEPFADHFVIRQRVDGVLVDVTEPPISLNLALVSRVKVMAGLDVAETRRPQDGHIVFPVSGREVDLRVSTLPTLFGESVVIRILDKTVANLPLEQLGMEERIQHRLERLLARPNGILLVTGPTGCGKTTTLYAALRRLNRPGVKIITTEDPVEYDIPGLVQISIQPKVGLSFAASLRHILRQDPDIIMVGEIRDVETARIAVQASLTGHLVLSTLHTNDAPSAVTRLLDMGIEPYLISSTLIGVLAQRLVRVICPTCRAPSPPAPAELEALGGEGDAGETLPCSRGTGCGACRGTGSRGRTGLFELLVVDDAVRPLMVTGVETGVLREAVRRAGMRTLREDGLAKVRAGLATCEDVIRETVLYD